MKKILCLVLLVGFAYSESGSGNEFLYNYPFGKKIEEQTKVEQYWSVKYNHLVEGLIRGNVYTTHLLGNTNEEFDITNRICGMTSDQTMRVIKKWCDDNPSETNNSFTTLVFIAFMKLPVKSDLECEQLTKKLK